MVLVLIFLKHFNNMNRSNYARNAEQSCTTLAVHYNIIKHPSKYEHNACWETGEQAVAPPLQLL